MLRWMRLTQRPALADATRHFASKPKRGKNAQQKAARKRPVERETPTRQNYLVQPPVDDGKKWRILSAAIVERLPVVQPDIKDWEMDMDVVKHEISLREDEQLEDGFWFMEPGERQIPPEETPWPNEEQDPEELIGAGYPVAPRETEDDHNDNRKSLNRALKGRVFLLTQTSLPNHSNSSPQWFFPVGEKLDEEKMRDAAVRHANEFCGTDLQLYPVGNAPIGYISYEHDDAKEDGFDGTKVFFYKSQVVEGDVALNTDKAQDYWWVTQEELKEYLDAEIGSYVKKIVPP